MGDDDLALLSAVLGWSYFLAWSVSFYPQLAINHRHRRSRLPGLSPLFLCYNFSGFAFYLVFTLSTYAYVQPPSVDVNDIAFAVHAFLITSVTIIQCYHYGGFHVKRASTAGDRLHAYILVALWGIPVVLVVAALSGLIPWVPPHAGAGFSLITYFGSAKVFITMVKYIPQAVLNWRVRSTRHWSIGNVVLDLTGGILSLLQQCVDAYRQRSPEIFVTNAPKMLLASLSLLFDFIFILQHYVCFPSPHIDDLDTMLVQGA